MYSMSKKTLDMFACCDAEKNLRDGILAVVLSGCRRRGAKERIEEGRKSGVRVNSMFGCLDRMETTDAT